jgi:malate dehydrogenase
MPSNPALTQYIATAQAILNIISNPVNSTVPIAAEALKKLGVYDKRKVLGVTTLDVVSTSAAAADPQHVPAACGSIGLQSGA